MILVCVVAENAIDFIPVRKAQSDCRHWSRHPEGLPSLLHLSVNMFSLFQICISLVEFCKRLLPRLRPDLFSRWVIVFGRRIITLSTKVGRDSQVSILMSGRPQSSVRCTSSFRAALELPVASTISRVLSQRRAPFHRQPSHPSPKHKWTLKPRRTSSLSTRMQKTEPRASASSPSTSTRFLCATSNTAAISSRPVWTCCSLCLKSLFPSTVTSCCRC